MTCVDGGLRHEYGKLGKRVAGTRLEVGMFEFQQRILPDAIYDALPAPFNRGSYLWAYAVRGDDNRLPNDLENAWPSYPGVTVEARKSTPTTVKYINNLPENPVLRKYLTTDRTIHWADPLKQRHVVTADYTGPIPTVVHLHGAEAQSTSDGAPEAWFTNNGLHGPGYFSLQPTDRNAAIYLYPNNQQAATLWFHDHSPGITRINIFSGLAAFYFIRDHYDTGRTDNPLRLPAGDQEIELLIQDRQFDTDGQLLWPDSVAGGDADRRCPARAEPVLVRSHQGPWLPGALPHPGPRGHRNDAAVYPGGVTCPVWERLYASGSETARLGSRGSTQACPRIKAPNLFLVIVVTPWRGEAMTASGSAPTSVC